MKVVIAMGANIGKPRAQIARAANMLKRYLRGAKISRIFISQAMYLEQQPDFYNAVVIGKSRLPPLRLLAVMQQIEKRCGRSACKLRNAPRRIDLDLVDCQEKRLRLKQLTLPHPAGKSRQFVMLPWAELSRTAIHPARKVPPQNCRATRARLVLKG